MTSTSRFTQLVTILCGSSFLAPTTTWSRPAAVVSARDYHASLIFDQKFDSRSFRPHPAPIVAVALAAEPPVRAPESFATIRSILPKTTPRVNVAQLIEQSLPVAAEKKAALKPSRSLASPAAPKPAWIEEKVDVAAIKMETKTEALAASKSFSAPKAERGIAKIFVLDEEALLGKTLRPVGGARVHWVAADSNIVTKTNADGVGRAPYRRSNSIRFIVKADGYLPAVGYALEGRALPVVLYKESRLGPLLSSLGVVPDPKKILVLGKFLDRRLQPMNRMTLETSLEKPFRIFYSLGSFGVFHPKATQSDVQGDFFISGINSGLQYLMPTQSHLSPEESLRKATESGGGASEWPASIVDFSGLPSVVSFTLQEPEKTTAQFQIVDGQTDDRPEGSVHVTVGGQRGVYLPDDEGFLKLAEVYQRGTTDLLEVTAQNYRKVWLSGSSSDGTIPDTVGLVTDASLTQIFHAVSADVSFSKGIVFGHLRPELFGRSVSIKVFDSFGRENKDAKAFYFSSRENSIDANRTATDEAIQNFAVTDLGAGEWHLVATDAKSKKVVGVQVLRTEDGTVSQAQF